MKPVNVFFVVVLSSSFVAASNYCNAPVCSTKLPRVIIIGGHSMDYSVGTILYADKYDYTKPIVRGDVVQAYNSEVGEVYMHRVTKVEKDYFLMKGDNNWWTDNYKYEYNDIRSVVCE